MLLLGAIHRLTKLVDNSKVELMLMSNEAET